MSLKSQLHMMMSCGGVSAFWLFVCFVFFLQAHEVMSPLFCFYSFIWVADDNLQ
jgi:CHASE2 domain-containing sensor protein